MSMKSTEQFFAYRNTGTEALLGMAQTQFSAFERLAVLNLQTARAMFEDGITHARAMLNAKDPQELAGMNAALAAPSIEKSIAYWRGVCDVAIKSQDELVKELQQRTGVFSSEMSAFLDTVSKNVPAGSEAALVAVKSALAATSSAYESFTRMSRQASGLAEAGFTAAMNGVKASAKKAA
jgi:phasin family protein